MNMQEEVNYNIHEDTRNEDFTQLMEGLLLGHRVVKVEHTDAEGFGARLVLDDGTVVDTVGNQGGCCCGNGDYTVSDLEVCDNIITKVETAVAYDSFQVFVLAEDKKVHLLGYTGDDNGYYGTGFTLTVTKVTTA